METAELLERCRRGDELAWEALVRQYQSRIYGIAYALVGNAEDARDVSQDVFIRLYKKLNKCRDPEMFVPWMIRITRNAAIDFLRRRKARPQRAETPVEEMIDLRADGNNPEEQYEVETRNRLVYNALQKLSGISREIIVLKDMQGLALIEIAEMLGIPIGTAKSRSNRARIELAKAVLALQGGTGDEVSDEA